MEKRAYWQYLNESLELDNFILPVAENLAANSLAASFVDYNPQAALGFFSDRTMTGDERTLFEKMVGAMGLTLQQVGFFSVSSLQEPALACRVRVQFSDVDSATETEERGLWRTVGPAQILTTYSLKNLIEQPALKKGAWEHLKLARAALMI